MSKKILVIDDEVILTKTFARLLAKKGFQVAVSGDSEDALAKVKAEDFDLLLSDIRMPGINGVETYRKMVEFWNQSGKSKTPVIFLTGYADEKLEQIARQLEPVAYFYKPFDAFKLLQLIEEKLSS